jgi:hypothetical protein
MTNFVDGDTVQGMFPVEKVDSWTRAICQVNLADHHGVVVAVMGNTLLVAYAATDDDDAANAKRPGFIGFPANDANAYALANWKFGKKFFIDAGRLAFVPANQVTKVGKLPKSLLTVVKNKAGAVRQNPLTFRAKSAQLVTGIRRQDRSFATA